MFKKIKGIPFNFKKLYKLLFTYPKDDFQDIAIDYDDYWEEKRGDSLGSLSDWQKERADIILSNIEKEYPVTVTDIGCGDGSILLYIKGKSNIKRVIGVDSSGFALNKAKMLGVETYQVNLNDLESIDEVSPSDYFLILEVLEHLSNPENLLDIIYKKTGKGIFFSFPNSGFILHRARLLFGRFPLQWRVHPSEHLRFWTYKDLKWWLNALGYKNYKIFFYKGVPILNKIFPAVFAMGFIIFLKKN